MVNVWKIAPDKKAALFKKCVEQKCIVIGFPGTPDFKQFLKPYKRREDRINALKNANIRNIKSVNTVLYFVDDIHKDDIVVANKGDTSVVGIGKITSWYLGPKHPDNPRKKEKNFLHVRLVNWIIKSH